MCQPDEVVWCDGSEAERERLTRVAVQCGDLITLNQEKLPGCYLHRSALNDVARTENLTFVCTEQKEDAGPNNNWMAPAESYDRLSKIFSGSMRGRTLYVIPFLMGPLGSPFSKVGSHGQRLCGAQHADHDAHGKDRPRPSGWFR